MQSRRKPRRTDSPTITPALASPRLHARAAPPRRAQRYASPRLHARAALRFAVPRSHDGRRRYHEEEEVGERAEVPLVARRRQQALGLAAREEILLKELAAPAERRWTRQRQTKLSSAKACICMLWHG